MRTLEKNATFYCRTHGWGGWILFCENLVFVFVFPAHTKVTLKPHLHNAVMQTGCIIIWKEENGKFEQFKDATMWTYDDDDDVDRIWKALHDGDLDSSSQTRLHHYHTSRNGISPLILLIPFNLQLREVWEPTIPLTCDIAYFIHTATPHLSQRDFTSHASHTFHLSGMRSMRASHTCHTIHTFFPLYCTFHASRFNIRSAHLLEQYFLFHTYCIPNILLIPYLTIQNTLKSTFAMSPRTS